MIDRHAILLRAAELVRHHLGGTPWEQREARRAGALLLDVDHAWARCAQRLADARRDGWPSGGDSGGSGGIARPTEGAAVANADRAWRIDIAAAHVLAAVAHLDAAAWGVQAGLPSACAELRRALDALDVPDVDTTPAPEAEAAKRDLRCDGGRVPGTHPCDALAVHDEWVGDPGTPRGAHVRLCGPCLDAWRAERRRAQATERKRRQREREAVS